METQTFTITASDHYGRISTEVEARSYIEALSKLTLQLISQELDTEDDE